MLRLRPRLVWVTPELSLMPQQGHAISPAPVPALITEPSPRAGCSAVGLAEAEPRTLRPLQVSRGGTSPYAGQSQGTRRPGLLLLLLLIGEHNCSVSCMEMGMTDVILNHRVITYL